MDMYELIRSGEIVQAVMLPFTSTMGETLTYFIFLTVACFLIYMKTNEFYLSLMVFIVAAGSISMSHLFEANPTKIIPPVFDIWVYIIMAFGIAAVFFFAWKKQ